MDLRHFKGRLVDGMAKHERSPAQDAIFDGPVKIRIRQGQTFSHPTVKPHHLPVPLTLEVEAGDSIPPGPRQSATVQYPFEFAVAACDHLRGNVQLATNLANVFSLDEEIRSGVVRIGERGKTVVGVQRSRQRRP